MKNITKMMISIRINKIVPMFSKWLILKTMIKMNKKMMNRIISLMIGVPIYLIIMTIINNSNRMTFQIVNKNKMQEL